MGFFSHIARDKCSAMTLDPAFSLHVPPATRRRIRPFFLPFAGCPGRCVFCDQTAQTGVAPMPAEHFISRLQETLVALKDEGLASELAFYGGSFTALPANLQEEMLRLTVPYQQAGLVTALRVSTRPDALDPATLARLRTHGVGMVELGVQSFANHVLAAACRDYDGERALAACRMVAESGLELGVQLMPGLIGTKGWMEPEDFQRDVELTASLAPQAVRLYPCLVMEGTPLAAQWRKGDFTPWGLEETVDLLAHALVSFRQRAIPVIRMGVAPEAGLSSHILAGPQHPALGMRVRAHALYRQVRQVTGKWPLARLECPGYLQGEFFGHRRELAPAWAALGIDTCTLHWTGGEQVRGWPAC